MAPALPIYNDRDSACPAGSSGKMLHLLCELAKRLRGRPVAAHESVHGTSQPSIDVRSTAASGGNPDIARIWSNDRV